MRLSDYGEKDVVGNYTIIVMMVLSVCVNIIPADAQFSFGGFPIPSFPTIHTSISSSNATLPSDVLPHPKPVHNTITAQKIIVSTPSVQVVQAQQPRFVYPSTIANCTSSTYVTLTAPTTNQYISSGTIYASGHYFDASEIQVSVDGGAYQWATIHFGGNWTYTAYVTNGWHTITVLNTVHDGHTCLASVVFDSVQGHQATARYNVLLVVYSEICQKMLLNNITSDCPTLDKLMPFDTTNATLGIAGHIAKNSNGVLYRTTPLVTNWWQFFQGLPQRTVCVDCTFDYASNDLAPMIFIEPHSFTYTNDYTQKKIPANQTDNFLNNDYENNINEIVTHDNQFVSPDCMSATIPFTPALLADTIYFIQSGCTGAHYNGTKVTVLPTIPFDTAHSNYIKQDTWLQQVKQNVTTRNCITQKCVTPPDPFKNWK